MMEIKGLFVIHFSKQIAPKKFQVYGMKVLSLTLSLPYLYNVKFSQILIQILMKKLGIRIRIFIIVSY